MSRDHSCETCGGGGMNEWPCLCPRQPLDERIAPPALADGTGARKYQPLPGDRVDIAPHRNGVHGVRVGVVADALFTHVNPVFVHVPGEATPWAVRVEHLTLAWRKGP